ADLASGGPTPLGQARAFSAESPGGQYGLGHRVGFRVEGFRGVSGVVEEIGLGPEGVDVLAVRRGGLLLGRTVLIPAERVEAIHPWDDTIVLASRRRPPGRAGSEARRLGRRARPAVLATGAATAGAAHVAATAVRRLLAAIATLLLGLTVLARRHAPQVRHDTVRAAAMLTTLARAYRAEARARWRDEKAAVAAWRERKRAPV